MKRVLSLALILSLSACSVNLPEGLKQPVARDTVASTADINAKADLFDLMLLSKDAKGVNNPVTPDQLVSLRLDGQNVAPTSILLPGSAAADAFTQARTRQEEAAKALQGKPVVIFGGNGAYTFVLPRSDRNSVLELQIKGQTESYKLIRFANLSRGTFVLAPGGQVEGGFNTRAAFTTKAEGDGVLDALTAIFTNPAGYYALAGFAISSFANFYQTQDGHVTVTTQDNQELVFEPATPQAPSSQESISDAEEAQAEQEVSEDVGAGLSPLQAYVGNWTLESDLIKALIPGGQLLLSLAQTGNDTFRGTASLASGSYSGESKVSGNGDTSTLNLAASSQGKTVGIQIRLVSNNRIAVKLTQAEGVAEASGMVGLEIFLKRVI